MERGIYFDGWFKHQFCYHPSLPMRSRQMLEDLETYHGTVLAWAGLGGGSISLPFLSHEAFGPVDPRLQIYGFMNDSEFIAECNRRGIKLFGIVFEVQGWEYPVVFDRQGHIIRMNQRAEESADMSWYGLREFSADTWPEAFPTRLGDYYPEGILDEEGNPVKDLLEACCTRDLFGRPIHAQWVEIRGHKEQCYQMCRNNPVWRGYLKKIIEIQIDAGVPGIQLDECELPMTSISSGGCFCKSCMQQFTAWLKTQKASGKLGAAWNEVNLDTFHYGEYLKKHECTFPEQAPFYREYWEFQVRQVRRYFGELADHARKYAREKYGRELLVSGNFYNMQPVYYPIENKVDIVITEMDHTLFRQPHYYRYCAGFAPGKPVMIAENPYGGIIPQLLKLLDRGKGYDLYRIFLLEASVYGCNMSVPYGGWMGNTIQDAFWPPRDVTASVQAFLAAHEACFPKTPSCGAAVLYAYGSYYWRDSTKGSGANGMQDSYGSLLDATAAEWLDPDQKPVPFWEVIRALSAENAQYDVLMLPDGELREDDFPEDRLDGYPLVIIPDCFFLTERQCRAILGYARKGGKILVQGRIAEGTHLKEQLEASGGAAFVGLEGTREENMARFMDTFRQLYDPLAPVACTAGDVGIQRFDSGEKTWVHLLNYRYDAGADRILPIDRLQLFVRGTGNRKLEVLVPAGEPLPVLEMKAAGNSAEITLYNTGLYTVLAFS